MNIRVPCRRKGEVNRWLQAALGSVETGVVHCCPVSYCRCVKGLTDFHKWLMGISVRTLELRVLQLYVVVRWGRDSPPLCKPSHRFPHVWMGLLQSRSPGGKEGGACPRSASPFSWLGIILICFEIINELKVSRGKNLDWVYFFEQYPVSQDSQIVPWWVHSSESEIYSVLPLSSLSLPLSVYLFPKTQEVLNPLRLVDMVCLPQGICLKVGEAHQDFITFLGRKWLAVLKANHNSITSLEVDSKDMPL